MTPHELARTMVTVRRDDRASYGRWRFSVARRATRPKAEPWLQICFATRAEAEIEATYYRRAIVDALREAAAVGVGAKGGKRAGARRK